MKILVAGVGNVLRKDDGFGVLVAQQLSEDSGLPPSVEVTDIGIGGIHLVQRLMDDVDALIVIDALDLARPPGTVLVVRPDVKDVAAMTSQERRDELADMHYATPERAFMLAGALGVLPHETWVVGCQPLETGGWGEGLSEPVERARGAAIQEVKRLIDVLLSKTGDA